VLKCDYCGRENPDDAIQCSGCANPLHDDPPVLKRTKAGFRLRAAARAIDTLFNFTLTWFIYMVIDGGFAVAAKAGWVSTDWQQRAHGYTLLIYVLGILAAVLYHTFCEGLHGATIGKLCCGLCVVREDRTPSNLSAAFIRSISFLLDSLFLGAVGYSAMRKSPLNQRFGDRWAKTAVLKIDELAPESRRSTGSLVLALGLGIGSIVVLVAVGWVQKLL